MSASLRSGRRFNDCSAQRTGASVTRSAVFRVEGFHQHDRLRDSSASHAPATVIAATRCGLDSGISRRALAVRLWWTMAFAVAAWCLLAGVASAQKYDTFQLDKKFAVFTTDAKRAGELERAASQLKSSRDLSKLDSSTEGMARFYLQSYIPWKFTQKEHLPEINKTFEDLLKDIDGAQRMSSPGARTLLGGTFMGMKTIAEGNYLPAARINAIHTLSRLNATALDAAAQRPPLPLSNSLPVMFKLYTNERENDGVRAAALHGMHHYTQFAFPVMKANEKQALVDEMNKLLAAEPPESRSPEAHAYLQRFAVDILNILRAPEDASLGTQLISISTSEKQPDLIALYSASKLGGLDAGLKGQVKDLDLVTKQWSLRAFNAVESELTRFASQTKPKPALQQPPNPITFLQKSETAKEKERRLRASSSRSTSGGGGMSGGSGMDPNYSESMGSMGSMEGSEMMDPGYADMGYDVGMMGSGGMMGMAPVIPPQPPEVNLSRRKVSFVLQQLLRGATGSPKGEIGDKPGGLMAAVEKPQQAAIEKWVASIRTVVDALNDKTLSNLELWTEALEAQRPALGTLAGVEVKPIEDPDKIESRPLLPFPGMPPAAPAEAPAEVTTLPGLPPTE